jgi:hypothetical protein
MTATPRGSKVSKRLKSHPKKKPDVTRPAAKRRHRALVAGQAHAAAVARQLKKMAQCHLPVHQEQSITEEERKAASVNDLRWIGWRRWPWITVWPDGWDFLPPPWIKHENHQDAITACLFYCLNNAGHLPRVPPCWGFTSYPIHATVTELPSTSMVDGKYIPAGIVMQYPVARCGEALAFIWSFHGGTEMQKIRQLIAAPTIDRIAEAYAIATGEGFLNAQLAEFRDVQLSQEPAKVPEINTLLKQHPELLRKPFTIAVLRVFRAKPFISWSANYMAKSPILLKYLSRKKACRATVNGAIHELVRADLVKPTNDSKGTGKRWMLHPDLVSPSQD